MVLVTWTKTYHIETYLHNGGKDKDYFLHFKRI